MRPSEIVDSVDVADVCADIDEVVLNKSGFEYEARPFVEDEHGYREVDVDLTEYPAIVAIAKRAFDTDRTVSFTQPESITDTYGVGRYDD